MIEMVTGKPAWGAEAGSVYRIGCSDELPLFPARLSSSGVDFLDKCLRRDYTRRWSCDQLLQHPFISMSSHKEIANHWSPRCVLDCFNSDFHEEEEDDDDEEEEEMVNLEGEERIRGLVSGGGTNWESEGWVVVRDGGGGGGGTWSGYSDLMEDGMWSSGSINSNLDFYHFNWSNINNNNTCNIVVTQCTDAVKRLYECSNSAFVYDRLRIFWILTHFVNFISDKSSPHKLCSTVDCLNFYLIFFVDHIKFSYQLGKMSQAQKAELGRLFSFVRN